MKDNRTKAELIDELERLRGIRDRLDAVNDEQRTKISELNSQLRTVERERDTYRVQVETNARNAGVQQGKVEGMNVVLDKLVDVIKSTAQFGGKS